MPGREAPLGCVTIQIGGVRSIDLTDGRDRSAGEAHRSIDEGFARRTDSRLPAYASRSACGRRMPYRFNFKTSVLRDMLSFFAATV